MTALFIAVIVVLVVLTGFITMAIRTLADNADKRIDNYFFNKLEDYDEDFRGKMEELERLKHEKENLEALVTELKEEKAALETPTFYKPRPIMRETFIPAAHYIDAGFFSDYKVAKRMLDLDIEGIIHSVMERNPYHGNLTRYHGAQKILEILNADAIFDMISLPGQEQMQVFFQVLQSDEYPVFLEYIQTLDLDTSEFEIMAFCVWLANVVRDESPIIACYFGEEKHYEYVNENVRCYVDQNVCDGVRILYQGLLYDYSIYETSVYETSAMREG